jgi:hypothetical protein
MKNNICVSKDFVRSCNLEIEDCINCAHVRVEDRIVFERLNDEELLKLASNFIDHHSEMENIILELIDFRDNSNLGKAKKTALESIIEQISGLSLFMLSDGGTIYHNLDVNYLIKNSEESVEQ